MKWRDFIQTLAGRNPRPGEVNGIFAIDEEGQDFTHSLNTDAWKKMRSRHKFSNDTEARHSDLHSAALRQNAYQ